MIKRSGLIYWLLLAALLGGCSAPAPTQQISLPSAVPPTQMISPSATPLPAATPQPTVPPEPTPLQAAALLDRYTLGTGMTGESITTSPGRVWIGGFSGVIEERDAASGALLQTIPLAPPAYDNVSPVKAMLNDGKRLWALFSWREDPYEEHAQLWIYDLATSQVVENRDISETNPQRMGYAPGQVWTQDRVFDVETRVATELVMPLDTGVFAYDGAGVMWVGGAETCEDCADTLFRYMVIDAANPLPALQTSAPVRQMLAAGERMWLVTDLNELLAYELPQPGDRPALSIDLSALTEDLPAGLAFDGQYLWLLSAYSEVDGTWLFRLDARSGRQISALQLDRPAENYLDVSAPVGLAFDGRDLWVLTARELLRIGLPWTR